MAWPSDVQVFPNHFLEEDPAGDRTIQDPSPGTYFGSASSPTLRNLLAQKPKRASIAPVSTPIATALTGQICLLTADEHEAFEQHCAGIRESLQPVGALELDLAQSIAEDHWRLKLARAIETGIFDLGHLGALATSGRDDPAQLPIDEALSRARTWVDKSENFQLLALYEQRIHRAIEKNMAQLRTLRAERQAARQQALEEAQLLAQLAQPKGEKYDPARGFPPELLQIGPDFSAAGLSLLIDRNQRLNEARHCAKTTWAKPMA